MASIIVAKYPTREEAWAHVCQGEAGELAMRESFNGLWLVIDVKAHRAASIA